MALYMRCTPELGQAAARLVRLPQGLRPGRRVGRAALPPPGVAALAADGPAAAAGYAPTFLLVHPIGVLV